MGTVTLQFLGQAGFVLKGQSVSVAINPSYRTRSPTAYFPARSRYTDC